MSGWRAGQEAEAAQVVRRQRKTAVRVGGRHEGARLQAQARDRGGVRELGLQEGDAGVDEPGFGIDHVDEGRNAVALLDDLLLDGQFVQRETAAPDVELGGAALPAVRIDMNPLALARYGIPLEDVRTALSQASANRPRGVLEGQGNAWQIYGDTPGLRAADDAGLVIAWRNGIGVRLQDIARVYDGPEDVRTMGLYNGERAVNVVISRQPGARRASPRCAARNRVKRSDIHTQVKRSAPSARLIATI